MALLWAGLVLTHIRVTFFGLIFLGVYALVETIAARRASDARSTTVLWKRAATLTLLTAGIVAPWIAQVASQTVEALRATGTSLIGSPSYNTVPQALLFAPHNRELMLLALIPFRIGLGRFDPDHDDQRDIR